MPNGIAKEAKGFTLVFYHIIRKKLQFHYHRNHNRSRLENNTISFKMRQKLIIFPYVGLPILKVNVRTHVLPSYIQCEIL